MIIDGKAIALKLNEQTASRISQLKFKPLLVDIVVGDDPVSLSYVKIKQKKAEQVGLAFELYSLPASSSTADVISLIKDLSKRFELCGLIIQLPLPADFMTSEIVNAIPESVDVDLLNKISVEKFFLNQSLLIPPTAGAIWHIMKTLPIDWMQQKILVLGQGDLVGKPTTHLLQQKGFSVSVADNSTSNTAQLLATADCIISGVGKSGLVKGGEVKQDVIIIDAGTSEASGTISGDVDFESVASKASYITPVPGGVGPVTVAKLLENVVIVAEQK